MFDRSFFQPYRNAGSEQACAQYCVQCPFLEVHSVAVEEKAHACKAQLGPSDSAGNSGGFVSPLVFVVAVHELTIIELSEFEMHVRQVGEWLGSVSEVECQRLVHKAKGVAPERLASGGEGKPHKTNQQNERTVFTFG